MVSEGVRRDLPVCLCDMVLCIGVRAGDDYRAEGAHLRWTCVKVEGIWIGWMGWKD